MNVDHINSLIWSIENAARDIESLATDLEDEIENQKGIKIVDGDQLYIRNVISDTRSMTLLMKGREPTDIELAEAIVDYIKEWDRG